MEIRLWKLALVRFYSVGRHGFEIFYERLTEPFPCRVPSVPFPHFPLSPVSVHYPNCVTSASPTLHIPQFMTITHQSNHRGFFFNRLTIMMCFGSRWISTVISSNPSSFLLNPNDMIYFLALVPSLFSNLPSRNWIFCTLPFLVSLFLGSFLLFLICNNTVDGLPGRLSCDSGWLDESWLETKQAWFVSLRTGGRVTISGYICSWLVFFLVELADVL